MTYEGLWWKPPLGPVRIPPHGPARFLFTRPGPAPAGFPAPAQTAPPAQAAPAQAAPAGPAAEPPPRIPPEPSTGRHPRERRPRTPCESPPEALSARAAGRSGPQRRPAQMLVPGVDTANLSISVISS